MRRKTFDVLVSTFGVVLMVGLVAAGSLLWWGYSFANGNVHQQLAAQKIFFPPKGPATASPEIGPFINKYAGQQLVNGAQAEAFANHFIRVHLKETAGGKTYAQMSTLARANPNNEAMQAQVQTLFRGETLRGMLLNAYAFWKIGQLARLGGIVAFAMAALFALLAALGFYHAGRVSPKEELLAPQVQATRRAPAARAG